MDSRLDAYVNVLYRWNRTIRLVGEKDPVRFREIHLAEVLEGMSIPRAWAWQTAVDIGAGNGLLAVPLAMAFPDRKVIALEPRGKKCSFLRHLRQELDLVNLDVRQSRLESFLPDVSGENLLWACRGLELPIAVLLDSLRRYPCSRLLLFSSPGGKSQQLLQDGRDTLRVLQAITPTASPERKIILAEITPPCFT